MLFSCIDSLIAGSSCSVSLSFPVKKDCSTWSNCGNEVFEQFFAPPNSLGCIELTNDNDPDDDAGCSSPACCSEDRRGCAWKSQEEAFDEGVILGEYEGEVLELMLNYTMFWGALILLTVFF
jgi:hypothetical protein